MSLPPKTTDELMDYLNTSKNIAISGSEQKRHLRNMGYYHGYKGYRYIRNSANRIPYTKFDELTAIYEFDSHLKALFYPPAMRIETALKNYVLESIIAIGKSDNFIDIYADLLDNYKQYQFSPSGSHNAKADQYKAELKRRLDLRNRIYRVQTDSFCSGNPIAEHYLNKDINLPIWAIFELLSLGEFGRFVSCLNLHCRQDISRRLGIRQSDDTGATLPQRLIYTLKDLRNAIAHDDVIFDVRFRTGKIDQQVGNAVSNHFSIPPLRFDTITDYLVLLVYLLSLLHFPVATGTHLIPSFSDEAEQLHSAVPTSVYHQILYTDQAAKLHALKQYLEQS